MWTIPTRLLLQHSQLKAYTVYFYACSNFLCWAPREKATGPIFLRVCYDPTRIWTLVSSWKTDALTTRPNSHWIWCIHMPVYSQPEILNIYSHSWHCTRTLSFFTITHEVHMHAYLYLKPEIHLYSMYWLLRILCSHFSITLWGHHLTRYSSLHAYNLPTSIPVNSLD